MPYDFFTMLEHMLGFYRENNPADDRPDREIIFELLSSAPDAVDFRHLHSEWRMFLEFEEGVDREEALRGFALEAARILQSEYN